MSRPAVPNTEPATTLRFSRIDDRCVCGAEFHAEGMPSWTARTHKDWLDALDALGPALRAVREGK